MTIPLVEITKDLSTSLLSSGFFMVHNTTRYCYTVGLDNVMSYFGGLVWLVPYFLLSLVNNHQREVWLKDTYSSRGTHSKGPSFAVKHSFVKYALLFHIDPTGIAKHL